MIQLNNNRKTAMYNQTRIKLLKQIRKVMMSITNKYPQFLMFNLVQTIVFQNVNFPNKQTLNVPHKKKTPDVIQILNVILNPRAVIHYPNVIILSMMISNLMTYSNPPLYKNPMSINSKVVQTLLKPIFQVLRG